MHFDEAAEYLIQTVLNVDNKPFIASIHGHPNQGKSLLMRICRETLYNKHEKVGITIMNGTPHTPKLFAYAKDYVLIEDSLFTIPTKKYCKSMFGKEPDITAFIAKNPARYSPESKAEYDLIIFNPEAAHK